MVKKVYKYDNMITLYVKARSSEKAVEKLNKRLNRITNQDVFYIPHDKFNESVIDEESLKEDIEKAETVVEIFENE